MLLHLRVPLLLAEQISAYDTYVLVMLHRLPKGKTTTTLITPFNFCWIPTKSLFFIVIYNKGISVLIEMHSSTT